MKRIRIGNEFLELAFNSLTGELLELVNRENGDNLLKNWSEKRSMPFRIELKGSDGETFSVCAPAYRDILECEDYKPDFELSDSQGAGKCLKIIYKCLRSRRGRLDMGVEIQIRVVPGDHETVWTINITNNHEGIRVETVKFPCLFGTYMGGSWKDDTLVYPFNAGIKVENPVEAFALPPKYVGWKWQEYKYIYFLDNDNPLVDDDGAYIKEMQYSGPASMSWMDYYGDGEGLYIASYDEELRVTGLHCETFGPDRPGMGFYMLRYPGIQKGARWESNRFGVAVHPGDWHWGADRYRQWRAQADNGPAVEPAQWFKKSPGLAAHYDFKYQNGEIVHRFSDISKIFSQAKEMGINHLLLSGWHKDGFDNGFPMYEPDPGLGTQAELIRQVQQVVNSGGHVSFYINTRLFNMKYCNDPALKQLKDSGAVMKKDGTIKTECYGDAGITFAVMCSASQSWQEYLVNTVNYLVDVVGADGMYLDQLSMGSPEFCNNEAHGRRHDWNHGYGELLNKLNSCYSKKAGDGRRIGVIYEGVSDIHGHKTGGQLISTFFYHHFGAFPELYRYTFPQQILVDMIYPSRGQVMRPVHVSQASRDMLERAFVTGCYFWIYDLEEDNTFRKDPEMLEYLKNIIRLRRLWLDTFGHGIYRDDNGIISDSEDLTARLYLLGDNDWLIALCRKSSKDMSEVLIDMCGRKAEMIALYQLGKEGPSIVADYHYEIHEGREYLAVSAAATRLALIHVKATELFSI